MIEFGLLIGSATFTSPLFMTLVALVIYVVGMAISDGLTEGRRWLGALVTGMAAAAVLAAVAGFLQLPAWWFYSFLALWATTASVLERHPAYRRGRPERKRWWQEGRVAVLTMILTASLLITSTASQTMWLPTEIVTVGEDGIVGYVLSVDETWTTLLRDEDRQVMQIPTEDLTSRVICDDVTPVDLEARETLFELLSGSSSTLPACDASPHTREQ